MLTTKQIVITDLTPGTVDIQNARAISIQGLPGTIFSIIGQGIVSQTNITLGPSGIYSIILSEPLIQAIRFTKIVGSLPIILDYITGDES